MFNDATNVSGTAPTPSSAKLLPELQAREAVIATHLAALDPSAHQAAVGEELLIIRDDHSYQAAGFKSFHAYLGAQRNPIKRPRAYQLIAFAAARRLALKEGRPLPLNERQVRASKSKPKPREPQDPFIARWSRVIRYLKKEFGDCSPMEQVRFAQVMGVTASFFETEARGLKGSAHANPAGPGQPIQASPPTKTGSASSVAPLLNPNPPQESCTKD
jgi:hypothetical protein